MSAKNGKKLILFASSTLTRGNFCLNISKSPFNILLRLYSRHLKLRLCYDCGRMIAKVSSTIHLSWIRHILRKLIPGEIKGFKDLEC